MDAGLRACIAYVAGCVISGTASRHIYDKGRELRLRMKGAIKGTVIEVFDYERNSKFMGTLPKLFDDGTNTAITLEISGSNFSGHDKRVEHQFVGTVEGRQVRLHDYDESRNFYYELAEG